MIKLKALTTKIWIFILCPIWSFIINVKYWLFHLSALKDVFTKKKLLLTIDTIENIMSMFKWTSDNYKDWIPWIITIVDNDIVDDCDGAATLAHWWCTKKKINSKIVYLYSADYKLGHAVCVIDYMKVVSNSQVSNLNSSDWRQDLLLMFNNEYSVIIEK